MASRRILGVIDSDSYAKWGASLLAQLGPEWAVDLVTVESRLAASDAQLAFALAGTGFRPDAAPRASVNEIIDRLNRVGHDAVFVSTSGAVAEAVITEITRRVKPRPVIMTGLPGISTPAKYKGLFRRAQADLFVLHSHREIREYEELASRRGVPHEFVLATLPFLAQREPVPEWSGERDSIVFAAQPGVPESVTERRALVGWLVQTALAHPELRVVIKVRAQAGERQTHRERHPYAELVPQGAPRNLIVEGGSMVSHLSRAVGFVTVSSTAAIEAIAARVPSLVLTDFGVTGELINEVFIGSGLLGPADDLIAARFHEVDASWRGDNYFHPAAENTWQARLGALAALRDAEPLPERPAKRRSRGGPLRRAWDRKRAFGAYDHSPLGYLAAAIGYPILLLRRRLGALRRALTAKPPASYDDGRQQPDAPESVRAPAGRE